MPASRKAHKIGYAIIVVAIFASLAVPGPVVGSFSGVGVGTVSINVLINYGNGTLQWYNGTVVPSTWNFFNVTGLVTNGNFAAVFFASFGTHFVYEINGIGCPTVFNCDNSWSLWQLYGHCWSLPEVGVDQIPVAQGATVAWFFTPVATFGDIPPTGVSCLHVNVDVKPPADPATIKATSSGTTPVAILSNANFDASTQVNIPSLTFGRTGLEHSLTSCNVQDVNGDGLPDLICRFGTKAAGFLTGDTEAILNGQTVDRTPIFGFDSVLVI